MIHKQTNTPTHPHTYPSIFAALRLITWNKSFSKSKEKNFKIRPKRAKEKKNSYTFISFRFIPFANQTNYQNIIELSKDM